VDPGPCRREGSGFFYVLLSLFKKCVLLTKVWRRRLPKDGIKSSPSSPVLVGRAEVCFQRVLVDLVGVSSNLRFSISGMVASLVCWSFGTLAR
jgi:hypothetical protein